MHYEIGCATAAREAPVLWYDHDDECIKDVKLVIGWCLPETRHD